MHLSMIAWVHHNRSRIHLHLMSRILVELYIVLGLWTKRFNEFIRAKIQICIKNYYLLSSQVWPLNGGTQRQENSVLETD